MYHSVRNRPFFVCLPSFGAIATKPSSHPRSLGSFGGMSVFYRRGMPYGQGLGGTPQTKPVAAVDVVEAACRVAVAAIRHPHVPRAVAPVSATQNTAGTTRAS